MVDGLVDELSHRVWFLPLLFLLGRVFEIQLLWRWLASLLVFCLRLAFFLLDLLDDAHHSEFEAVLVLGLWFSAFFSVGVLIKDVGIWRFLCLYIKMLDSFRFFPPHRLARIVPLLHIRSLFLLGHSRLMLKFDVHRLLPHIAILRPIQTRRHLAIPLIACCLARRKLIRKYLDEILKDEPHSIMQIPYLAYYIFCGLLGDLLMHLDVHVAVNEIVGIDLCVIVHFVVFELHHPNLYS